MTTLTGLFWISNLVFLINAYQGTGSKHQKGPKQCQQEAITNTDLDFWGNQYVTIDDKVMLSDTFGYASALRGVKHSSSSRYPVASISKLFTSIAIWQLHEQGVLDINTPISQYLDVSDFVKIGYDDSNNPGVYCPKLLNSDICQDITFSNLLSMNSGIVAVHGSICPYDISSPFIIYCQNPCNDIWYQPYQGSIGYYMQFWINAPLTFPPGDGITYEYSNANYVFAGYLIEKLTGLSYKAYIEENIFIPLGLENTYYDPFDGHLGINTDRVRGHLLYTDETTMENIGVGECQSDFQIGFWNSAAGLITTNEDIHRFYRTVFDKRNQPSVLFENAETVKLLLYPYVSSVGSPSGDNLHFAHGVNVKMDQDNDGWPELIIMGGKNICTRGWIMLVYLEENNAELIVSVLSNAPRVYTSEAFMQLMRYGIGGIPNQVCHLLPGLDFVTGFEQATALLEQYSGLKMSEDEKENEVIKGDNLWKKEDREKIKKLNKKYKEVRGNRARAKNGLAEFVGGGEGEGIDDIPSSDLITIKLSHFTVYAFVLITFVLLLMIIMISCWIWRNKKQREEAKYAKVNINISDDYIS